LEFLLGSPCFAFFLRVHRSEPGPSLFHRQGFLSPVSVARPFLTVLYSSRRRRLEFCFDSCVLEPRGGFFSSAPWRCVSLLLTILPLAESVFSFPYRASLSRLCFWYFLFRFFDPPVCTTFSFLPGAVFSLLRHTLGNSCFCLAGLSPCATPLMGLTLLRTLVPDDRSVA